MDMMSIVRELSPLKRSLVSEGYDKAIELLSKHAPVDIVEFKTDEECWTWKIPPKWTCSEAYLETMDGRRIIDYKDHPLHCVEYSTSVDKIISREDLLNKLFVHKSNPAAIPYVFNFYERDWGLCCSQQTKETLDEDEYHIVIDTAFEEGSLKVAEWWLPGESENIFVLSAHLCHVGMANDDIAGTAVALEVMERLQKIQDRYYTYVLILHPETIGSTAWLARNEHLIQKMKGGLFLEMLGTDLPLSLQRSYFGDTQLDKCCEHVVNRVDNNAFIRDFWELIRNDEIEFNSPGVRVPMLSVSRVLRPENKDFPYPEYHTNFDTIEIINKERLDQSVEAVLEMISCYENNYYPKAKYKGQVFCSRYGIYPDDPTKYHIFFKTMFDMDGKHTIIDICRRHNFEVRDVLDVVYSLKKHNLVDLNRED